MHPDKKHSLEIWAQLWLSREDCDRIKEFFTKIIGVKPRFIVKNLHLTVQKEEKGSGL